MHKITLLLFLTICTYPSIQAQEKALDKKYAYVDSLLNDFLAKTKVAGFSVAVYKSNQQLYAKGFGYADVEQKITMKATSQTRTASVAKVITATALGKLASEAKLDFDTPLSVYMPYLEEPFSSLTTRQIASHTAGIPHRPASKAATNKHYTEVKETLDFFKKTDLNFAPGTQYQYSTLGFNLLAMLIEEVSGKRFVDYMQEEIFAPLGMSQTFPDQIDQYSAADAKMYYFKKDKLRLDNKIVDGSYKLAGAGFRSTAIDLARMMQAYSNGFITENVRAQMFSNTVLKNGESTNVGIAWRLNKDLKNRSTLEHAGSWQGARTVVVYYPEEALSIVIMVNTKSIIFIEETAHLLAQLFLSEQASTPKNEVGTQALSISNHRSDGSIETYQGVLSFSKEKIGQLTIETEIKWLKDNRLYYISAPNNYALSTPFGLIYLQVDSLPKIQGELYLYQVLSDQYHMQQKPMLRLN